MAATPSTSTPHITYTTTTPVARATSLAEFLAYLEETPCRPVTYRLTEGEKSQLAAFSKWKESYLIDCGGDVAVLAHDCTSPRFFDVVHSSVWQLAQSAIQHPTTLGEFVRNLALAPRILSGTELYMRHDYQDRPVWNRLLHDFQGYAEFLPPSSGPVRTLGLWVSGGGTSSQLHFDTLGEHNLNFQICGRKLITLYAPTDGIQNLYPLPSLGAALSLVDPYHPDVCRDFPRVVHSQPHVLELCAGSVLWIPARWWHDVRHLDPFNVNVTAWCHPEGKLRHKWEGSCFCVTWWDTLVAWSYMAKLAITKLVIVAILACQVVKQWKIPTSPEWIQNRKKE